MVMETKKRTRPEKVKKGKNGDLIEFLREKKARDGRLNKLGEWLLANEGNTGWYITGGSGTCSRSTPDLRRILLSWW